MFRIWIRSICHFLGLCTNYSGSRFLLMHAQLISNTFLSVFYTPSNQVILLFFPPPFYNISCYTNALKKVRAVFPCQQCFEYKTFCYRSLFMKRKLSVLNLILRALLSIRVDDRIRIRKNNGSGPESKRSGSLFSPLGCFLWPWLRFSLINYNTRQPAICKLMHCLHVR